jgi:hypothetical protein
LYSCAVIPCANSVQILHSELEASLQSAQDDLASTNQDLEKHRELNDRLESDLLKLEQSRGGQGNGDTSLADDAQDDILAGLGLELNLTTKNVRCLNCHQIKVLSNLRVVRKIPRYKRNLYPLHPPPIRLFCPSSQANVTASDSAMLSLKR